MPDRMQDTDADVEAVVQQAFNDFQATFKGACPLKLDGASIVELRRIFSQTIERAIRVHSQPWDTKAHKRFPLNRVRELGEMVVLLSTGDHVNEHVLRIAAERQIAAWAIYCQSRGMIGVFCQNYDFALTTAGDVDLP